MRLHVVVMTNFSIICIYIAVLWLLWKRRHHTRKNKMPLDLFDFQRPISWNFFMIVPTAGQLVCKWTEMNKPGGVYMSIEWVNISLLLAFHVYEFCLLWYLVSDSGWFGLGLKFFWLLNHRFIYFLKNFLLSEKISKHTISFIL